MSEEQNEEGQRRDDEAREGPGRNERTPDHK